MAYDEDDNEVLDIDAVAGEEPAEGDEMEGFHEVDPLTGAPVVDDTDDDDELDEDEPGDALL